MDQFPWDDSETEMNDNEKTLSSLTNEEVADIELARQVAVERAEKAMNEVAAITVRLLKAKHALRKCVEVLPGLEARSWPPGHHMKKAALALAHEVIDDKAVDGDGWLPPEVAQQVIARAEKAEAAVAAMRQFIDCLYCVDCGSRVNATIKAVGK